MINNSYCRLYIKCDNEEDELRDMIASYFGGKRHCRSIEDEFLNFYLYRNKNILDSKNDESDNFIYYPYTAEVHARHDLVDGIEPVDIDIYIDILCHIIIELRKNDVKVVASCSYEDIIAKKTGWNWSKATPIHPSYS